MKYTSLVAIILLTLTAALAQSGNSVISGTVRDASDAPIVDAKVKIINIDTGVQSDTVSNSSGLYRAAALLPGAYRIEADSVGFDHLTRGPLTLQVGQTIAVDLILQVGKQSETVNVTESAPLTESQSSNI